MANQKFVLPFKGGTLHVVGNKTVMEGFHPDGPNLVIELLERDSLLGNFLLKVLQKVPGGSHSQGLRVGVAQSSFIPLSIHPGDNNTRRLCHLILQTPRIEQLRARQDFYSRIQGSWQFNALTTRITETIRREVTQTVRVVELVPVQGGHDAAALVAPQSPVVPLTDVRELVTRLNELGAERATLEKRGASRTSAEEVQLLEIEGILSQIGSILKR